MKKHSLVVQLNHPGSELKYKSNGRDFFEENGNIIRPWNTHKIHYRKFLCNKGSYINNPGDKVVESDLLFWGEWEGFSEFQVLGKNDCFGIHFPFYRSYEGLTGNIQNTDPYVYGDYFKYATCKQRGKLLNLEIGSLVLFGSSFKDKYVLDTVFVVGEHECSKSVFENNAANYTEMYKNATLKWTGTREYISDVSPKNKKIYKGISYDENDKMFSYVPCKPNSGLNSEGFPRVSFDFNELGLNFCSNYSCVKYLSQNKDEIYNIWKKITDKVLNDGFSLGTHFNEPLLK